MANVLRFDVQVAVVTALIEGNSTRSVERMTRVHRDTITRLGVRVGEACAAMMDREMRDLECERIQVDEIWGFVAKKQKHVLPTDDISLVGDQWTWVAIDADTKIVPSHLVGKRDGAHARAFICDLASRLKNRVQISSDALASYVEAIEVGFGGDVDYGQLVKVYAATTEGPARYSPPKIMQATKNVIVGHPRHEHICTSYVERQNLTMRMAMRRLTRLTNAFSKKVENLRAAVALHFAYYNYCRRHLTLKTAPAIAAGLTDRRWTVSDLLDLSN